jgi:NADH-quinone oxidoreductase E subunit
MAEKLSSKIADELNKIMNSFPDQKSCLMNALRVIEREYGQLDEGNIQLLSDALGIAPSHIWGMVTFYTHFNRPKHGRYRIMICCTLMCALRGSFDILDHLKSRLGIDVGECTPDGKFSIEKVECLASCGTAPVVQINEDYYENLTPEKLDRILDSLK